MATAEMAAVLPVLVLLILTATAAVAVGQARIRCADGAREAARAVSRGDLAGAASLAAAGSGRPVRLAIRAGPTLTVVTVGMSIKPLSWLPALNIVESATAATEPSTDG